MTYKKHAHPPAELGRKSQRGFLFFLTYHGNNALKKKCGIGDNTHHNRGKFDQPLAKTTIVSALN
jgi:hypothetical protein